MGKSKEDLEKEIAKLKEEKQEKEEIERLELELKELKKSKPKPLWLKLLLMIGLFFLAFGKMLGKLFMSLGKKFNEMGDEKPKNKK